MQTVPFEQLYGALPPMTPQRQRWAAWLWPLTLAFAIPLIVFWLQKDVGLSLLDEGFLWYGAQRVLHGEVPLLDFQAYDIGRYYWYAAWMWLMGSDGIVPLRAASAVLAGCAVAIALTLLVGAPRRQSASTIALAAATFALWMVPHYKVADSVAALLLLAGLAGLVADATARSWLHYGLCLGVAATIGINHAFYGVLAALLFLSWARWHGHAVLDTRRLAGAAAGAAIGYAPVIACHLLVPGFTVAFVDTIRTVFDSGTTNLGRPIHSFVTAWSAPGLAPATALRECVLIALLLVLAPVFGAFCIRHVLRREHGVVLRRDPLFVASVIASVAYAHYVVSRADIAHLGVSVLPLLMAAWTCPMRDDGHAAVPQRPSAWLRGPSRPMLALFVLSGVLAAPAHALFERLRGAPLQSVAIAGEVLRVSPDDARAIRFLQQLGSEARVPPLAIYVAPYWPGAYAALRVRSPAWEIYSILPATAARQRREIRRLQQAGVAVAVVQQVRMDGRDDLGFAQTHPLIASYLSSCMAQVATMSPAWLAPRDVDVLFAQQQPCDTP